MISEKNYDGRFFFDIGLFSNFGPKKTAKSQKNSVWPVVTKYGPMAEKVIWTKVAGYDCGHFELLCAPNGRDMTL